MANVALSSVKVTTKVTALQPNGLLLAENTLPIVSQQAISFSSGTGTGQANRDIFMRLNITTSGTMVMNVSGATFSDGANSGTLVDSNGASAPMSKLKHVEVRLVDTTGGPTLAHINAAASSAIGSLGGHLGAHGTGADDQPGQFLWTDSVGVTVDSTHQTLNVVNESALAGQIDVHIIGSD